ncbi:MAG: hypothetical protein BMS9Abin09_1177 [Gammaproteobacteria bacterium]|nr:MAG: hypothetical protein BMS9Abin09_1177 [Gammaproteobacteria bacterium]
MILSGVPFSAQPFSTTDLDFSVASLFNALIANQEAPRAYLLRATPYDPVTGAEIEVRASIGLEFPIIDGKDWPAILKTGADTQVDLLGDELDTPGRTAFGNIELLIGDGKNDALLQYFWDGHDVEVLMGAPDFSFSDFQRVVFGTASDAAFDTTRLSIVFRGRSELLDVPVQTTLYAGTGGLEGGADITSVEKPLIFGPLQNVSPVLVDRVNQIYQIHDGNMQAVTAAYDGAAVLTAAGDVADITATTVTSGQYKTQLSGGYIRLGAEPAKTLTLDVEGDDTVSYVQTAADIIRRIVENYTVLTTADLDLQSFSTVNLDNSAPVGIFISAETARQAITSLIESIGGAWTFTRQGLLTIAVFRFSTSVGQVSDESMVVGTFSRVKTLIPSWSRKLGYARAWTVQPQDTLVGSATNARKDFVAQAYRFSLSEDATIKTSRKLATRIERNTLLANKTDADAEVVRQQGVFGSNLQHFHFEARNQQFKYRVGQTITMEHQRFGILSDVIILGLRENTGSKITLFHVMGDDVNTGDFTAEFTGEYF